MVGRERGSATWEEMKGRHDYNTLHTCMKFSNNEKSFIPQGFVLYHQSFISYTLIGPPQGVWTNGTFFSTMFKDSK